MSSFTNGLLQSPSRGHDGRPSSFCLQHLPLIFSNISAEITLTRGIERFKWKTPFKCSAFTSIPLIGTFLEKWGEEGHPSSDQFLYLALIWLSWIAEKNSPKKRGFADGYLNPFETNIMQKCGCCGHLHLQFTSLSHWSILCAHTNSIYTYI